LLLILFLIFIFIVLFLLGVRRPTEETRESTQQSKIDESPGPLFRLTRVLLLLGLEAGFKVLAPDFTAR
jgi:hypothetical protein